MFSKTAAARQPRHVHCPRHNSQHSGIPHELQDRRSLPSLAHVLHLRPPPSPACGRHLFSGNRSLYLWHAAQRRVPAGGIAPPSRQTDRALWRKSEPLTVVSPKHAAFNPRGQGQDTQDKFQKPIPLLSRHAPSSKKTPCAFRVGGRGLGFSTLFGATRPLTRMFDHRAFFQRQKYSCDSPPGVTTGTRVCPRRQPPVPRKRKFT